MTKKELISALGEKLDISWKQTTSGGNIWFERKNDKKQIERLIFGVLSKGDGFSIIGVATGQKHFPEVENIIKKYYAKFRIDALLLTIRRSSQRDESMLFHIIREPKDLSVILPKLKTMVYEEIFPFFSKYESIEDVHEMLESMEISQMSSFIYPPMPVRRLILKRLVNDPDFEPFGALIIEQYKENSIKYGPPFAIDLQYLPELFKDLKLLKL